MKAEWTIMMYIAADDTLASFAIESLKQLKRTAGDRIAVAVQFDPFGFRNRPEDIRNYIFTGMVTSLQYSRDLTYVVKNPNMTDPASLTQFIDHVFANPNLEADHYCLILWGHGPELLFESPVPAKNGQGEKRLYLAPQDLGKALADAAEQRPGKLDIIGIDACAMSMIEVACEIKDYARYLVASQDDVPDMSFPYDTLLELFRTRGDKIEDICKVGVDAYAQAYEDYKAIDSPDINEVTLSSLRLEDLDSITLALKGLAHSLKSPDSQLWCEIYSSRKQARDFVGGVYVDLSDFCHKLHDKLVSDSSHNDVASACKAVYDAIDRKSCIVANRGPDGCHGLSIYFPLLAVEKYLGPELVKGTLDTPKKHALNDDARQRRLDVRQEISDDTQAFYEGKLKLNEITGWKNFIDAWKREYPAYPEKVEQGLRPGQPVEKEEKSDAKSELEPAIKI